MLCKARCPAVRAACTAPRARPSPKVACAMSRCVVGRSAKCALGGPHVCVEMGVGCAMGRAGKSHHMEFHDEFLDESHLKF